MNRRNLIATVGLCWLVLAIHQPAAGAVSCTLLANLKGSDLAAPADPLAKRALGVWEKVRQPVLALHGLDTAIQITSAGAGLTEFGKRQPLPVDLRICVSGPPVVYVTYPLLELVYTSGRYARPDDLLAFMFSHELAHRVADFSPDGRTIHTFNGSDAERESLADMRAAFFSAVGGFSTRALAPDYARPEPDPAINLISQVLDREMKVPEQEREVRRQKLIETLQRFDAYEKVYEIAVALAFGNDPQTGRRLLEWVDELMSHDKVSVPEVTVMRALVLIIGAAPDAPWFETADIVPDHRNRLLCQTVYPGHTALVEPVRRERLMSISSTAEKAREDLLQARDLLEKAGRLLNERSITVASARACVAFYLGDPFEAARRQAEAGKLMTAASPAPVRESLAANGGLIRFQGWLEQNRKPDLSEKAALKAWKGRLSGERKRLAAHAGLDGWIEAVLTGRPIREKEAGRLCRDEVAPTGQLSLPEVPAIKRELGACPDGWSLIATVPMLEKTAPDEPRPATGVTLCQPPAGFGADWAAQVLLPATLSPAYDDVKIVLLVDDSPVPPADRLETWACGCGEGQVERKGVSDLGTIAYSASCPAFNDAKGTLFADQKGRVVRLVGIR